MKNEYAQRKSRHPLLCRWWCQTRQIPNTEHAKIKQGDDEWQFQPLMEFYVPWWAYPFELFHRVVFGRTKLTDIEK